MGSCLSGESRSPLPCSPASVKKRKNSKRRFGGSRSSSFDFKKDEYLVTIPGRLFANGSSDVACLFTQQGKKGTNQDAMVVWENFFSRTDTIFCGVFDGHGPNGHLVAKKVRDTLPQKLNDQWEINLKSEEVPRESNVNSSSMNSEGSTFVSLDEDSRVSVDESRVSHDVEDSEKESEIYETLKDSFLKAFKMMDRELRVHTGVDCFCSGTTAVTLIKKGQYLVVGNVGDSRAVLGTREEDDTLVAVQLTVDLKPNLPAEAERIKKCRGRVFALRDEPDVARVWLPNSDSPGLAMARAFGDFCLKDFGVIAVPDISFRRLTEKDQFIVLATDGIWDVLSNKEVVDIVGSSPSRATASKTLVETAVRAWKVKYPTSKIDDCAAVCLFLDSDPPNNPSCSSNHHGHMPVAQQVVEDQPDGPDGPDGLDRSSTVRTVASVVPDASDDDGVIEEEMVEDWSALEGVTRVNTLLNLPRFTTQEKR